MIRYVVLAAAAILTAGAALADPMAKYLGEARPILIFAPERYDERLLQQIGRFSMHRKEYRDRHITVIEIGGPFMRADGRGVPHGPELRARYGVPDDSFTLILLGKDGEEKLRVNEVTDPLVLYELIDSLPARQEELQSGG